MDADKAKILDVTRESIDRKFGKGSLMRLGDHEIVAIVGDTDGISGS